MEETFGDLVVPELNGTKPEYYTITHEQFAEYVWLRYDFQYNRVKWMQKTKKELLASKNSGELTHRQLENTIFKLKGLNYELRKAKAELTTRRFNLEDNIANGNAYFKGCM